MEYIFTNVLTNLKNIMKANKILIVLNYAIYAALPCHAMNHRSAFLTELQQKNVQPEQVNLLDGYKVGTPFLHAAIRRNASDAVDFLLTDLHADIEVADRSGNTPLSLAMQMGNLDIAARLLQRGANINAQGADKNSPLHMAASFSNDDQAIQLTQLLLQHTQHPNPILRNRLNKLALHIAASRAPSEIAGLLLQSGAVNDQVNAYDDANNTPLHIAIDNRREAVVALLMSKLEIDPNLEDGNGNRPLHLAVSGNNHPSPAIANSLISHVGINVNAIGPNGNAPLHLAVRGNNPSADIVGLLLQHGANANQQNMIGDTPLHAVAMFSGTNPEAIENIIRIIEILIGHRANACICNHAKTYPRDLATNERVKYLVNPWAWIALYKGIDWTEEELSWMLHKAAAATVLTCKGAVWVGGKAAQGAVAVGTGAAQGAVVVASKIIELVHRFPALLPAIMYSVKRHTQEGRIMPNRIDCSAILDATTARGSDAHKAGDEILDLVYGPQKNSCTLL